MKFYKFIYLFIYIIFHENIKKRKSTCLMMEHSNSIHNFLDYVIIDRVFFFFCIV